ncbi:TonB-dependent receptor [Hyphomonas sp. WL0036]|uniref:TonB-dependent receptor plug domain-containing protein n=1 Tax=Hyphomonas sediminis TaxID=2866160 RepID=UPI001C81B215|nr:TonB-dependent receptor [Hyphomonas sediminis]MBY9068493.1 TonB-dependent receptor [Hyphomonas sediminis]
MTSPILLRKALVLSASGAALCLSNTALAEPVDIQDDVSVQETVIVTGTRGAPRTTFDSLAPVDVISDQAIDLTASDEVMDTLAQLVPSFNVKRLPMADGQVFVRPASLRSLSADHTLVLVNGKRFHRSALLGSNGAQAPDLAQIPSYAIKRIEVLRDGASAQYGSDAIAGVINVILDDAAGTNAFAQAGQYYEGDGEQYRLGAQQGFVFGNGFLNLSGEYTDSQQTSRSRQRPDAEQLQEDFPELNVPNPVQHWGQPERQAYRFAANAAYDLGVGEVYAFSTYGWGAGVSDFNWRNPVSTSAYGDSVIDPDYDLSAIYPAGFSPRFGQDDTDFSITGGYRSAGDGPFSYDLSASYGRNQIDYYMHTSINASLGSASPTSFDIGTLTQSELNLNADFVYLAELDFLSDDLTFAFGAERRKETYRIGAGEYASYAVGPLAAEGFPSGSNGFPGFSPDQSGSSDQTSFAGYVDIEAPVTDRWTVGAAVRYEDFSEFGSNTTGKVSTRFEVTPNLAVRATASTGFRAPTPGQLFSERTSQGLDTTTLNIFTSGRFSPQGAVAAVISQRDGVEISPLEPEESENLTAGIAWNTGFGLNATLDIYQIDVTNRLSTSATFAVTDAERAQFAALGVAGAESITRVNFYQNDFDTRTKGLDLVVSYGRPVGPGDLTFTGAYNYNKTDVTGGAFAANATGADRFEKTIPEHTGNLQASYALGKWDVFGRMRYYGAWRDYSGNATGDIFQDFGSMVLFDIGASYAVNDALSVRVGAENVFDQYPDEATYQASRGLIYSRNAPYDTDGGQYYVRLDVSF